MKNHYMNSTRIFILISLLLIMFCSINCNASSNKDPKPQTEAPLWMDGWLNISIPRVARFQAPPTLEIQGGDYKKLTDAIRDVFEITYHSDLTLQQKGLNNLDPEARQQYCRILVNTTQGSEGEFCKLNEKPTYSKEELSEIEEISKLELEKQFSILDWYPITVEKINGNYALKLTYRRSLKSVINPVFVTTYTFQNHRMMHTITLSYRESEKNLWKTDLDKVIQTFVFDKQ